MKICHIDTETTGVDPRLNGIIQVSGLVEANGKSVDFDFRMQPFPDDVVEDGALNVNNVTREQIATFMTPNAFKKEFDSLLCRHINKFAKTDKMFFVGYNASFDWNFMQEFYKKAGDKYFGSLFWFPFIDTATLAGIMLGPKRATLPNFKLGTVCNALGIKIEGELHDAMTDVLLSKAIYDMFIARHNGNQCSQPECLMRKA